MGGWVTVKGNQGTSYVEETDKFYVCKRRGSLDEHFETDGTSLRMIEEGEAIEVLEEAKTETKKGPERVKCRLVGDGVEGWCTLGPQVQEWTPQHKCSQKTVMHDGIDSKASKVVRDVESGETLEVLDVPLLDKTSGILRVRARAEKDGVIGYATIRDDQGIVI